MFNKRYKKIIEIGKQPLYSDLFNYANTLLNEIDKSEMK